MEKEFEVRLLKKAEKELGNLPLNRQVEILREIKTLKVSPFPNGRRIRKIRALREPIYRLKVKDYRVLFAFSESTVTVLEIIHRKDLEKILKRLL